MTIDLFLINELKDIKLNHFYQDIVALQESVLAMLCVYRSFLLTGTGDLYHGYDQVHQGFQNID